MSEPTYSVQSSTSKQNTIKIDINKNKAVLTTQKCVDEMRINSKKEHNPTRIYEPTLQQQEADIFMR